MNCTDCSTNACLFFLCDFLYMLLLLLIEVVSVFDFIYCRTAHTSCGCFAFSTGVAVTCGGYQVSHHDCDRCLTSTTKWLACCAKKSRCCKANWRKRKKIYLETKVVLLLGFPFSALINCAHRYGRVSFVNSMLVLSFSTCSFCVLYVFMVQKYSKQKQRR